MPFIGINLKDVFMWGFVIKPSAIVEKSMIIEMHIALTKM
jgi:hypothetical protein